MKNIVLRPLQAGDAGRMLAFARAAGQETKNLTFGPEGLPLGPEAERAYLAAHGQGADTCELGAFDGETLVAAGSVSRVARRPRMAHRFSVAVSVRKSYWGQGIATAMMERLIAEAKAPRCWSWKCSAPMRLPFTCMKSWAFVSQAHTANFSAMARASMRTPTG